jgi:hypothetical protein
VRLSLHEDFISELQSLHAGVALLAVRQRRLGALATLAEEGRVATGNDRRLRALTAAARHGLAEKKEKIKKHGRASAATDTKEKQVSW